MSSLMLSKSERVGLDDLMKDYEGIRVEEEQFSVAGVYQGLSERERRQQNF